MAISSTSYPNQKLNIIPPKVVIRKFNQMKQNAINDPSILCFQAACLSIGWRSSKVDYWVNKLPIFEKIKKDIQEIITIRINNGALTGQYKETSSIWRMKMLGESEVQHHDHTSKGDKMTPAVNITVTDPKTAHIIQNIDE